MTESEKYYAALGKFIDSFSRAESAIQIVLWQVGDIDLEVAKSIFSGTRTRTAVDFIKRIAESKNILIPDDIQDAFIQLNAINTTRDNIVHFGTSEAEDGSRIISNRFIAHTERSVKEFPISTHTLQEMSGDLGTIMVRLVSHFYGQGRDTSDAEWEDTLRFARAPFRYKPPKPDNKDRKTPKANGKSQPRRKASPV